MDEKFVKSRPMHACMQLDDFGTQKHEKAVSIMEVMYTPMREGADE